jgi:low affinity Fe/Cu permease
MRALQTKVDELIRSSDARNHLIGVERLEKNEPAPLAGG